MYPLVIAISVLALYGLWQPSFPTEVSAENILITNSIPGTVSTFNTHGEIPQQTNVQEIDTNSYSAVVYDEKSKFKLWAKNENDIRSIASLTKLMTALVFINHNPGWEKIVQITDEDHRDGNKAYLFLGDRLTVKNLFYTGLIASDNTAITTLVRSTGLTEEEFVNEMNQTAIRLRLKKTHFVEPTGLDSNNQSSAYDLIRLALIAFENDDIQNALKISSYNYNTENGKEIKVITTNDILRAAGSKDHTMLAGKTGYLPQAGYCFVGWFEEDENRIITVVLGAPESEDRFTETEKLVKWAFQSFSW